LGLAPAVFFNLVCLQCVPQLPARSSEGVQKRTSMTDADTTGAGAPAEAPKIEPVAAPGGGGTDNEGGGKPKGTPDDDESKKKAKEQAAKAIRADRSAENPEQSLLDALDDYMVLCGGDPLAEVRHYRVEQSLSCIFFIYQKKEGALKSPASPRY
jgi:hypothetical protein